MKNIFCLILFFVLLLSSAFAEPLMGAIQNQRIFLFNLILVFLVIVLILSTFFKKNKLIRLTLIPLSLFMCSVALIFFCAITFPFGGIIGIILSIIISVIVAKYAGISLKGGRFGGFGGGHHSSHSGGGSFGGGSFGGGGVSR